MAREFKEPCAPLFPFPLLGGSVVAAMVAPGCSLSTHEAEAGRLGVQASGKYTVRPVSNQSLKPNVSHSVPALVLADVGIHSTAPLFSAAHPSQLGRHESFVISRMLCNTSLFAVGVFSPLNCPEFHPHCPSFVRVIAKCRLWCRCNCLFTEGHLGCFCHE